MDATTEKWKAHAHWTYVRERDGRHRLWAPGIHGDTLPEELMIEAVSAEIREPGGAFRLLRGKEITYLDTVSPSLRPQMERVAAQVRVEESGQRVPFRRVAKPKAEGKLGADALAAILGGFDL